VQDGNGMAALTVQAARGRGGTVVLTCRGEIDFLAADQFRTALLAALDGEPPNLLVDLTDVPFIDSTGLVALLAGYRKAEAAGVVLRVKPSPFAARLITVAGLLHRINLELPG
jgi:anti-anti-sigma factor